MGFFSKKKEVASDFTTTTKVGSRVILDENAERWAIVSQMRGKRKEEDTFNFSDIVDFELLEDGTPIASGGLGRAAVGGILFGGVGAIVGGVTGKRKTNTKVNSLRIKVTMNSLKKPAVYIDLLPAPVQKDSNVYRMMADEAQQILSTFQVICNEQEKMKIP